MLDIVEDAKWHLGKHKHSRFWAVWEDGQLVCLCVYRKGAREVVRRLGGPEPKVREGTGVSDHRKGAVK